MKPQPSVVLALFLAATFSTQAGIADANQSVSAPPSTTLFADCQANEQPKHLFSPVSVSEGQIWRAYVEVEVRSDLGCLHTTRLWVAQAHGPYRLLYLMPPKRWAVENGMEVMGWAPDSRLLLVRTEEWQYGSDAPDTQQILAIDAKSGMVYDPNLEEILEGRKDKQCWYRVTDAGFSTDKNVVILVRAQISTFYEVDQTEVDDVPLAKRCEKNEETWSFNYATGEIKQVANTEPLQLFKRFVPRRKAN